MVASELPAIQVSWVFQMIQAPSEAEIVGNKWFF
jgi:hypothetical protein